MQIDMTVHQTTSGYPALFSKGSTFYCFRSLPLETKGGLWPSPNLGCNLVEPEYVVYGCKNMSVDRFCCVLVEKYICVTSAHMCNRKFLERCIRQWCAIWNFRSWNDHRLFIFVHFQAQNKRYRKETSSVFRRVICDSKNTLELILKLCYITLLPYTGWISKANSERMTMVDKLWISSS